MDTNTFVGNLLDRGPWILWDTVVVAQAASTGTSLQPFSLPISPTKTKLLTNMQRANQLPAPQRFMLQSLGFYYQSDTFEGDITLFEKNCYFEFRIDQKIYHEGVLQMFPAGFGLQGMSTKTAESAWVNGVPSVAARRMFGDYARVISDNQLFSLSIIFPTAQTMTATASGGFGMNMLCVLDGILDRSVQ